MKTGKAAGSDEVTAEALKYGGNILAQRVHSLICLMWRSNQIPHTWKVATIVPIFKKGDPKDCNNYRGISLLSIIGKVFMLVLQLRLQKLREQTAREEQAGFRPGRGCSDQVFTLRQLLEEHIRCGKRLIVVFINFKAAFDSVHWPALWTALQIEGVPAKIVRLLQNLYESSNSQVHIQGELSNTFPVCTGVQLGCVLSPLLFNTVVDAVMRKVFDTRQGIQYGEDQYINDLMYADDSAILAEDEGEATDLLHKVAAEAEPYGLKIKRRKNKGYVI
uniref:Reverse transcriptase domain-containing protein n=1 Tax=Plectus sambesii TaxID=2011161 RepID=A0A914V3Q0_9BILA